MSKKLNPFDDNYYLHNIDFYSSAVSYCLGKPCF